MVRHFFLDKTATIVRGSSANLGLNPILELNYGDAVTRFLIHFDIDEIKALIDDREFAKPEKVRYKVKLSNCFSANGLPFNTELMYGGTCGVKERASSFYVISFRLPQEFDEGRGFDLTRDAWINTGRNFSFSGANWFQAQNGYPWAEPGVYSTKTLEDAYQAYMTGATDTMIVGRQHFDFGDEDLEIDVTDYVNDVLNGEFENYGLGFSFSPMLEETPMKAQQYVGFFSRNTNTFFKPYLEAVYDEAIEDDRATFYIGKENKLYLYASADGQPVNLDDIPICTIDGVDFECEQAKKGVYFARISPDSLEMDANTIHYDEWSNLFLNGQKIDDVEMEFVALPLAKFATVGQMAPKKGRLIPTFDGLNDGEGINVGEIREVGVDFRSRYTTDKKEIIDSAEYRIYTKDGNREYEICDGYQPIERTFLRNFFVIHAEDLMPGDYYVDVRVKQGREELYYKQAIRFGIVEDVTKKYC